MLFDYLAEVNEEYKKKIYKGDYKLVFVDKYSIRSNFLLLLKVNKNIIKI